MILVVDDAKIKEGGCFSCPAKDWQNHECQARDYKLGNDILEVKYGKCPNWCPLIKEPNPAKSYLEKGFEPENDSWKQGWDDCLKAIKLDRKGNSNVE